MEKVKSISKLMKPNNPYELLINLALSKKGLADKVKLKMIIIEIYYRVYNKSLNLQA